MSKLPLRSEIRKQDTWDLECIFKNERGWEKALLKESKRFKGISKYQEKLNSIKNIQSCLNLVSDIERHLETVYIYATYMVATDMGSSKAQLMEAKVIQVFTDFSQSISFITPELLTKKDDFLKECIHHKDLSDHVMT